LFYFDCEFDSHQEHERDVIQRPEAMLWEHGVVGSNPTIPTLPL
jgi:hypothetical protein